MAGDQEWAEPVEIVDGEESTTEIEGGRPIDWHAVVRTGAAVVAALSLLWIGRSMADERSHVGSTHCANQIGNVVYRYENAAARRNQGIVGDPPIPLDVVEGLIEDARDCGDDALADALEYEYVTSFEDDD